MEEKNKLKIAELREKHFHSSTFPLLYIVKTTNSAALIYSIIVPS
jgi:hypothetical protein